MSPHLADLMIGSRQGARKAALRQYGIRTSAKAIPRDIEQLRRAFARTAPRRTDAVTAVDVSADRGCFLVVMEVVGAERGAIRECERAFAVAWYDAFGQRSSTHVGWLSDAGPSRDFEVRRARGRQRRRLCVDPLGGRRVGSFPPSEGKV